MTGANVLEAYRQRRRAVFSELLEQAARKESGS
jgi:hypothetical protein